MLNRSVLPEFLRYYDLCWLLTVRCYSANDTAVRPHGISHNSFLVYLPNLPIELTFAFWTSLHIDSSSTAHAFVSGFCSSGYDFAIPSSRLHLAIQTLGVAIGFVGNYAPCGLSPQTNGMPVIQQCTVFAEKTVLFAYLKHLEPHV